MKHKVLLANYVLLFLCVSMYLGTGWSLLLFSFPVSSKLTVQNYYLEFVPQVTTATAFFTQMTKVMIVAGVIMLVAEWRSGLRWVPIVVLLGIIAATLLTVKLILPLNAEMASWISEESRLHDVLARWIGLNKWRVSLWTIQWFAMMWYFGATWLAAHRGLAGYAASSSSSRA